MAPGDVGKEYLIGIFVVAAIDVDAGIFVVEIVDAAVGDGIGFERQCRTPAQAVEIV
jgi:hypothetical protein